MYKITPNGFFITQSFCFLHILKIILYKTELSYKFLNAYKNKCLKKKNLKEDI